MRIKSYSRQLEYTLHKIVICPYILNSTLFKLLRWLITIALFVFVFHKAGLFSVEKRDQFIQLLKQADVLILCLSVLVGVLVNVSSSIKWWMLAKARNMQVGLFRMFAYYVVGQFYNLFLPTSVGGDVVRAYELGKYTNKKADALASVFVERYTGVLVLLLLAFIAFLIKLSVFNVQFVVWCLVLFAIVLGVMGWMAFDNRVYSVFRKQVANHFAVIDKALAKLDKLMDSIGQYKNERTAVLWAFFNSLVFYLMAILNVYITARVFQLDISFVDIAIATPIIMLIMNIPLSIGNLGIMEFAYTAIFQMIGYSPALGLSVALLMRLKSLLDGAMGGMLHPLYTTKQHSAQ